MNYMIKRDRNRHFNRASCSFTTRLRNRVCSNSCLKVVYLSCATLISASFIIECILLHLIIVPYLSESIFEEGVCKYIGSRREELSKRCENKCSKERSSFPCLQLKVLFAPLRKINQNFIQNNYFHNSPYAGIVIEGNIIVSKKDFDFHNHLNWINYTIFDFESPESRVVYLYDYFSTFTAHKASRCSTSPCHRREEDNRLAVEEFKRDLLRKQIFRCYARPTNPHLLSELISNHVTMNINSTDLSLSHSSTSSLSPTTTTTTNRKLNSLNSNKLIPKIFHLISTDPKDSAAILHRLYTSSMFLHGLLWPSGTFIGALIILLFTYFADGCQAWAGDKTVIA